MPQTAAQVMPQSAAQVMPQYAARVMPQSAAQVMPQYAAQDMPQSAAQDMPQSAAQDMPQSAAHVMSQIDMPKTIKLFIFDFDLTLTTEHTKGIPDISKQYFSVSQLKLLKELFASIKNDFKGSKIIILSRSIEKMLRYYMKNYARTLLQQNIHDLFNEITDNIDEIIGSSLDEYKKLDNDIKWAQWKVDHIKKLIIKYNTDAKNVIFFDDTQINIEYAKANNFINSFIVSLIKSADGSIVNTNVYNLYLKHIYPLSKISQEQHGGNEGSYYILAKNTYNKLKKYIKQI